MRKKIHKIKLLLISTLFSLLISLSISAQVPQKMSYQAVIRGSDEVLVVNTTIGMKVSILQGSESGVAVYEETQTPTTNSNGLVSIEIGGETGFDTIDWSEGPYYIKTETDPTGGTDYTISGISQLMSVPYAFYSVSTESFDETDPLFSSWDKSDGILIEESQITDLQDYLIEEAQTLSDVVALGNSVDGQIKDLSEPTDNQDAATKNYVDLNIASLASTVESLLDRVRAVEKEIFPPEPISDIDGNIYPTVLIGDQEWMAENLRVTKYNNGDLIPTGLDGVEWGSTTEGAFAVFPHGTFDGIDSEEEMADAYGHLYNWFAVEDSRGLCPSGWHVPTEEELHELLLYVYMDSGSSTYGNLLKSRRMVDSPLGEEFATSEHPRWNHNATHYGTDDYGFSALPSGVRAKAGNYIMLGQQTYYWTSTSVETNPVRAWRYGLLVNTGGFSKTSIDKELGLSIRCVRD